MGPRDRGLPSIPPTQRTRCVGILPLYMVTDIQYVRSSPWSFTNVSTPQKFRSDAKSLSPAHPDPTISPVLLKTIGKRLRDNYGWAPEHFESRLGADAAYFDDDLD
jgi:hypothetical protein